MKKIIVEGQTCVGPHFSKAEFNLIKQNITSQRGLDTLADLLAVAGNAQRLKILYLLHMHREMCVCDLAEVLGLSDSAVSQHLHRLRDRHLVQSRRDAQSVFYSLRTNIFTTNLQDMFALDETEKRHAFMLKEAVE